MVVHILVLLSQFWKAFSFVKKIPNTNMADLYRSKIATKIPFRLFSVSAIVLANIVFKGGGLEKRSFS